MLNKKQILEIKKHLGRAQNPLFFFDNDDDGLVSFLLLRRYIDRGKGIAIKSFPDLNSKYYRKVNELNPDYIFILDKPEVSKEFLEKARRDNIPIVWIDHHNVRKETQVSLTSQPSLVYYYNSYEGDETGEPVSYLCYEVTKRKEDVWLAVVGCIGDCYLPEFYDEFKKRYPELAKDDPDCAFDVLYGSEIGKIAMILNFSLKDTTTNVVKMMKFMMKIKSPMELLKEDHKAKSILRRYKQINKKYQALLERARKERKGKMLYFQYGGDMSLSGDISNQLSYEFPNKLVVVVYMKGDMANISLRGKKAREITLEAIKDIEGATGGGHEMATGVKMSVSDLPKFKERVSELL